MALRRVFNMITALARAFPKALRGGWTRHGAKRYRCRRDRRHASDDHNVEEEREAGVTEFLAPPYGR